MLIITPLGSLVNLADGVTPKVEGSKLVIGDVVESFSSAAVAQGAFALLLQRLKVATSTSSLVTDLSAGGALITSVSPNPFNPVTDTITIGGAAFGSATLGVVHIEDWPGSGTDDDGLTMTPTLAGARSVTAVLASLGNNIPFLTGGGATPGDVVFYMRDSSGNLSNLIYGVVAASGEVTLYL